MANSSKKLIPKDRVLVLRAQAGDRMAFGMLYERHRRIVFTAGLRITKNEADAEDVVQETFVSALRFIGAFDHKSTIKTWLYRIAINHSLMILRRINSYARREAGSLDAPHPKPDSSTRLIDFIPGTWESPEKIVSVLETIDFVNRELRFMSAKLRRSFVLHAIRGLDQKEVAALNDCSVRAIKARLWRARQQLRIALHEREWRP